MIGKNCKTIFVLSALLLVQGISYAERNKTVGEVIEGSGSVVLVRKGKKIFFKEGSQIKERDQLKTGLDSQCFFEIKESKTNVRLGPNSSIVFPKKKKMENDPQIQIEEGILWFSKKVGDEVLRIISPLN
ncbi:hypothetical protein BVX98_05690, partial [bacterium F11]